MKIAIVTGGSSGIGKAACATLAEKDCKVYELSRHEQPERKNIVHVNCDISVPEQVEDAVAKVMEAEGRIDILINNAGFGISGAIEFTSDADVKKQFEVNFFGMDKMCRTVVPIMRKQGSGRIVNLSSVAGPVAIPFQAYYSATKAAIAHYTYALLNEVRPFGIEVVAILPGDIHTGFTAAREKSIEGDKEYNGRISHSVSVMEHDELNGMPSEKAGALVAGYALKKHPAPSYILGNSYKLAVFLQRFLSNRTFYYIVGKLYS